MAQGNLQQVLEQVAQHFGYTVGAKVKSEIEKVIQAENVDIDKLQSAIETIQGLLDADPNTPEFDVGQNIVSQLTDHLNRIVALENAVNTLNGDESTVGSVDFKVKQAKDDLQAQINALKGENGESVTDIQSEIDAIEAGAGLDENGNYVADTEANYIKDATSIHNATQLLDTELKNVNDKVDTTKTELEGKIADAKAGATDEAKQYIDEKIDNVDICVIASMFAQAIDCGLQGKTESECCDTVCNTDDSASNSESASAESDSGSTDDNASDSGEASGDGAVL